jgi:hypothetical protein
MHTSWLSAEKAGRSPLNIGRSSERNKRKQQRHAENVALRASLHQQRVRDSKVQGYIDDISKRK